MRRADRLFQIVQHLRARRLTTARQLAAQLGISERTVYRDIRDLSLSGIPVQGEAGVGYSLDRGFELTALMFTPKEVETIVVGLRMAAAFGGPELRAAAAPALDKVILALPRHRREEVDRASIYVPEVHGGSAAEQMLERLRPAIERQEILELSYLSLEGELSRRRVWPLGVHFWGSVWTLAAWCEKREDLRTFRLDRIGKCTATLQQYPVQEGRRLEDYLRVNGVKG